MVSSLVVPARHPSVMLPRSSQDTIATSAGILLENPWDGMVSEAKTIPRTTVQFFSSDNYDPWDPDAAARRAAPMGYQAGKPAHPDMVDTGPTRTLPAQKDPRADRQDLDRRTNRKHDTSNMDWGRCTEENNCDSTRPGATQPTSKDGLHPTHMLAERDPWGEDVRYISPPIIQQGSTAYGSLCGTMDTAQRAHPNDPSRRP